MRGLESVNEQVCKTHVVATIGKVSKTPTPKYGWPRYASTLSEFGDSSVGRWWCGRPLRPAAPPPRPANPAMPRPLVAVVRIPKAALLTPGLAHRNHKIDTGGCPSSRPGSLKLIMLSIIGAFQYIYIYIYHSVSGINPERPKVSYPHGFKHVTDKSLLLRVTIKAANLEGTKGYPRLHMCKTRKFTTPTASKL